MLNSVLSVPDANPSPTSGDRTDAGDGDRTHGRSGEAQTDPAAVGFAASRSQVSEARASQRRGAGLCPPALPNHEERPQPHDALSSWEGLSRWAHVAEVALANELCNVSCVCVSSVSCLVTRIPRPGTNECQNWFCHSAAARFLAAFAWFPFLIPPRLSVQKAECTACPLEAG